MENLSVKILDALFDLCEGENYVILDKEDIIADFPDHDFETDELTEILEALTVEGFIDLKYADNTEYCVAMKTKGRTLIKQSREKLQRMLHESSAATADDVIDMTPSEDIAGTLSDEPVPPSTNRSSERRRPRVSSAPEPVSDALEPPVDGHFPDSGKLSRGYNAFENEEVLEERQKRRERRTFVAAVAGAAVGSIIIDLILLVIILIKLKG